MYFLYRLINYMLNLILFGPPGSGKGTQANQLKEAFNLKHISTGDLLREEKANETPLGLEAKKFMDAGLLVPDDVVIGMISSKLDELSETVQGFIFDGFPRTVAQAEALDKLLKLHNADISIVLALDVPEEEVVTRLLERGKTSGRADDANEEKIRARFVEYETKTAPLANYFTEQGKFKLVAGVGNIEEIFSELQCEVNEILSSEA